MEELFFEEQEKSEFDSDLTYMYKVAAFEQTPLRFMLVNKKTRVITTLYTYTVEELKLSQEGNDEISIEAITSDQINTLYDKMNNNYIKNNNLSVSDFLLNFFSIFSEYFIDNSNKDFLHIIDLMNGLISYLSLDNSLQKYVEDNIYFIYNRWNENYQIELEELQNKANEIIKEQNYLYELKPLEYTDIRIKSTYVSQKAMNYIDPLLLFDRLICDISMPYVFLNFDNEKYYKIYSGDDKLNMELTNIIPTGSIVNEDNTLYILLSHYQIPKYTRESYILLTFNLLNQTLEYNNVDNIFYKKVNNRLFFLELGNLKQIRITGEVEFIDAEVDEATLLYAVLNDNLLSTYLYSEESLKTFAEKKRLTIRYKTLSSDDKDLDIFGYRRKNPASVSITLYQDYNNENDDYVVGGKIVNYPNDTPIIKIMINKANDENIMNNFLVIFSRLYRKYMEERKNIRDIYSNVLGIDVYKLQGKIKSIRERDHDNIEKLNTLKRIASTLFIPKYAILCQGNQKPEIIPENKIKDWTSQKVKDTNQNKQVLPFPAQQDRKKNEEPLHLICANDDYPYPGLKKNKLENSDIYPFLPCCFKYDHMSEGKNTYYNEYYRGIKKVLKGDAIKNKRIKSNKIVPVNRLGFLPKNILNIISQIEKDSNFYRQGTPISPNSFLHSVCIGLEDKEYIDSNQKENYVRNIRKEIANKFLPELYKQELYDYDLIGIKYALNKVDEYFNPMLFYKGVEEYYNINIVVFSTIENLEGYVQVPRYKSFPIRRLTKDKTLLIYNHIGTKTDALIYPQCEIITKEIKKREYILQNKDEYQNLLISSSSEYMFDQKGLGKKLFHNRFYIQDYIPKGYSIKQQFIDSYGKLRAINIGKNIEKGEGYTVIIPPSIPLNLPMVDNIKGRYTTLDEINYLGEPTAIYQNGLWFKFIDEVYGVYVPLVKYDNDDLRLEKGPANPFVVSDINPVQRTKMLKKILDIFIQVINYYYLKSNLSANRFMEQYTVITNTNKDSLEDYTLENIPYEIPEDINNLALIFPSFTKEGKIKIRNVDMFSKINKMLNQQYPKVINNIIQGRYNDVEDFTTYVFNKIFIGIKDIELWLSELQNKYIKDITITTLLDDSLIEKINPVVYKNKNNMFYIIQNVNNNDFMLALEVATIWTKNKINLGYLQYNNNTFYNELGYYLYGISPDQTLVPLENKLVKNDKISQSPILLRYSTGGSGQYAALLPLIYS